MATHTMRGFSKRIKTIAKEVGVNSNSMMRKTVITVASAVALRTPVDTGRARSNWQTQIGSAAGGVINNFAKGSKGTTGAAAVAQVTSQAVAEMERLKVSDTDVYISNNLVYIDALNKGSSQQAPAGFIQSAIMAGLSAIRKSRLVK